MRAIAGVDWEHACHCYRAEGCSRALTHLSQLGALSFRGPLKVHYMLGFPLTPALGP